MKTLKENNRLRKSELGAGFVEMALLIALIGVVSIAGAQSFGQSLNAKLDDTTLKVDKAFLKTEPCSGGRGRECGG